MSNAETSELIVNAIKGLQAWASEHLADLEDDASEELEFNQGDFVVAPESKVYCRVDEGEVILTSGDESLVTLKPGDFIRSVPKSSNFQLMANGIEFSKCTWFAAEAIEGKDENPIRLPTLESNLWHAIAETLAPESNQPQTAVALHEPGDILIREGDKSTCVFEMIGGEAEVVVAGSVVGKIHSGEFFGEYTFLVEEPRSATVRAISHCTVQEISSDEFERLIQSRPQIMLDIARDLAKRLHSTNQKVDSAKQATRKSSSAGRYRIRVRT